VCINRLCIVITLSSILKDLARESFWVCIVTVIRYWADSNFGMKIASCIFCWVSYLIIQKDSIRHSLAFRSAAARRSYNKKSVKQHWKDSHFQVYTGEFLFMQRKYVTFV
jgi:hypothetical protein